MVTRSLYPLGMRVRVTRSSKLPRPAEVPSQGEGTSGWVVEEGDECHLQLHDQLQ